MKRTLRIAPVLAAGLVFFSGAALAQKPDTRESQALPSLAPLVDSVKAAVVNVEVASKGPHRQFVGQPPMQEGPDDESNPFAPFFGQPSPHGRQQLMQGMGSGTIIDSSGIILTNNHVVEGAVSITVKLDDGRSFDATIVGRDPATDVAVIKLKEKVPNLPSVKLGDSDAMRVGDWVVAIGNPFGLASSVSAGIISAKARNIGAGNYDDFLQTDAAINPGNSGGPLFNMHGEVIGINTAIVGQASAGIGFAVPSNLAKALLPMLEKEGTVTRGWLGISIGTVTPQLARALRLPVQQGAVVYGVNPGSPAEKAGLHVDDVVTAIDGAKVASGDSLTRIVALKRPGSVATLEGLHQGKPMRVRVTLGKRPDLDAQGNPVQPDESAQASAEEEGRKQRIGLALQDMNPSFAQQMGLPPHGALVTDVVLGSPADHSGIRRGMVIVEADHKPVPSARALMSVLKSEKSGSTILLRVATPGGSGTTVPLGLDIP